MLYTRREMGTLLLAGLPMANLRLESNDVLASTLQAKPQSKFAGVQIGWNITGDQTLDQCLQAGISGIETRSSTIESFLGIPPQFVNGRGRGGAAPPAGQGPAGQAPAGAPAATGQREARGQGPNPAAPGGARGGGRAATPLTPEQEAERRAIAEDARKWRLAVPMSKVREFRKKYEDAGVVVEILKFDGIFQMTDDMIDYSFELAKNVGARALSAEISVPDTKRLGQFADKHKMLVGYHNHAAITPKDFEEVFSYAKYNGANVDLGHFVAGNSFSPVPFIKQYHDRITHVHVKDRKFGTNGGANVQFGQGDTPVVEVLRLIRDNKWKIQATLELEYPTPAGSDRLTEVRKCVEYCKNALLT